MKIRISILLMLCCLAFTAIAQDFSTNNKKAIRLYQKGVEAIHQGHGEEAVSNLEQALEQDANFHEAHLMLAEWFTDQGRRKDAIRHYKAVTANDPNFFIPAWYALGELELADGNYDDAIKDFETYLKLEKRKGEKYSKAQNLAETAKFRKQLVANPVPFNPKNMGAAVNSRDDEYLPALTADGQTMVFTRRSPRRATTTADTHEEEDIFSSTFSNGSWSKATRMPEPLNSNDNEGAECISQDGRIMFFTACNRPDGGGRCDLYMCIRRGDTWGKPRNLGPQVNSNSWEGQPSFSIDGKTLYFVSNRKGGFGGMDIWKTVFENGHWSEPVNLGPQVNTAANEMSPFIHNDDKTLYFASEGHMGMGGLDIFVTRRNDDGSWQQPRNLGWPINTPGDESNLIVSADAHTAIYSSDRDGGLGKLDLWQFEMPEESRPAMAICFKGKVTNSETGAAVGSDIKVVDLEGGNTVANTSSDAKSGEYIVSLPAGRDYAIMVTADGYLFHSQNQPWSGESEWRSVTVDIALQPIAAGSRIALRNVFFETGKWDLLPQSEYELGKVVEMLSQNPKLKIELGGHTDNIGQPAANQKLSEQRAKAVRDYLVAKGIKAERLTYKGYGETQPVATNDSEEGRAQNRRTELKVLE